LKKILFATEDARMIEELRRGYQLDFLGQVERYDLALDLTRAASPDGVVLADDLPLSSGPGPQAFEQWLEAIKQSSPGTIVVRQPRAQASIDHLVDSLASSLGLSKRSPTGSQVVAVYSLRGGVGKSTTAANLAWELAQSAPTVLLDLDLRGGTIRHLLGIQDRSGSLIQAARIWDSLDGDLKSYLSRRGPLDLLLPPDGMEACLSDSLSGEFLAELIRRLALSHSNVIIDLPPDLMNSPAVLAALERASRILLVAQPSRAGLSGLAPLLAMAADLGLTPKMGLLLSRVRGQIDQARLEKDLIIPILGQVPEDRLVPEFEDAGMPIIGNPKSPAGQAIKRLAASLGEMKAA